MEKIIFNKNGQWNLVKNWSPKQQKDMVFGWGEYGNPQHKDTIPPTSGKLRSDMLNHLENRTKVRVNPDTGEKEYRLFRAHTANDQRHQTERTSWSTHPDFCLYWADINRRNPAQTYHSNSQRDEDIAQEKKYGKYQVSAAWVPEKHVHSFLPPLQVKHGSEKEEGEAIVSPHDVKIDKTVKSAKLYKLLDSLKGQNYPSDYID